MSESEIIKMKIEVPFELSEEEKKALLKEIDKTSIREIFKAKNAVAQRVRQWELQPEIIWEKAK